MIPAAFEYFSPQSVKEAIGLLEKHGDDAKILAGGHSLLPIMKLRLAQPKVIVDIGRISGLSGIKADGQKVAIGALTTHDAIERDAVLKEKCPLLAETAAVIGDMQVRNRGTIGGSAAHADPAADYPAALLALGAEIVATGPKGTRTIPAGEFFVEMLTTALKPTEIITELRVPVLLPRLGSAQPGLDEAVTAIRSQWTAYRTPSLQRRPNQGRRFLQSEPVAALMGYYRTAGAQLGIDWTYLAAINYVETDFGRNNGPSAAGAQGPMQFLPSTWDQVGGGGDIMNARDAIFGAARFLRQSGAPGSYQRAVFAYNNDQDYVDAVAGFAAALRADPLWLTRLYYWNTYG